MKTLRRLLLALVGLAFVGVADARGHQLVLRRQRRHGLRALPRDPAAWSTRGRTPATATWAARTATAARSRPSCACTRRTCSACGCTRAARRPSRSTSGTPDVVPAGRALRAPATARSTPTGRAGRTARRTRRIFINPEHNSAQQLMDDCLRCHAMHFEGGIRELVTPLDRKGPWTFVLGGVRRPAGGALPRLPLGPPPGEPFAARSARAVLAGPEQEIARPSLALYDRRALEHVGLERLPLPAMQDGGRAVVMSPDRRQALCYQCHAPRAGNQVFSGDDRTPVGVHEGLSCLACHAKHGQTTRASCAACHPRLSNCGQDVEKMDTTFKSAESLHDIHRVACLDCHPEGVPREAAGIGVSGSLLRTRRDAAVVVDRDAADHAMRDDPQVGDLEAGRRVAGSRRPPPERRSVTRSCAARSTTKAGCGPRSEPVVGRRPATSSTRSSKPRPHAERPSLRSRGSGRVSLTWSAPGRQLRISRRAAGPHGAPPAVCRLALSSPQPSRHSRIGMSRGARGARGRVARARAAPPGAGDRARC